MRNALGRIRSVIICLTALTVSFFVTLSTGFSGRVVLADGERTTVTMDMLRYAYEQHYEFNHKASGLMAAAMGILAAIVLTIIIVKAIKLKRYITTYKTTTIITIVSLIPLLAGFLLVLAINLLSLATDVAPEKASYCLKLETVIRTEAEESSDEDGDKSYTYYVYLADDRRESGEKRRLIDHDIYEAITEPGEYYFAEAYKGRTANVFGVYPASSFEPAPDVEVR